MAIVRFIVGTSAFLVLLLGCVGKHSEVTDPVDLEELNWLSKDADRLSFLTLQPSACISRPQDPGMLSDIRVGQLAFESSYLLGGQARSLGLSCSSCHRNGRGNADFFIATVSDSAGHADVTSGVFSKVRADNEFNPVPIPDLASADGTDQIERTNRQALRAFTLDQIQEEFNGDAPPEPVLESLLTYLQSISPEACPADRPLAQRTWQAEWQAAKESIGLARRFRQEADIASAEFFVRLARERLGRLNARYDGEPHAELRNDLVRLSRLVQVGSPTERSLEARIEIALRSGEPTSLYNEATLKKRLQVK